MLVICIPTITEHLVVAVQPHHFNSQSQCNQLGAFTKSSQVEAVRRTNCFPTLPLPSLLLRTNLLKSDAIHLHHDI